MTVQVTPKVCGHFGTLSRNTSRDAGVLLTTRSIRAFVDGIISLAIPALLPLYGFSGRRIGVIVAGMMLGSAAMTLLVGTKGNGVSRRSLLFFGSGLMIVTKIMFGSLCLQTWR